MSHITSGILGGAATAILFGAISFASGSDLRATVTPSNAVEASQVNSEAVNRGAKSDRAQVATIQDNGRTLSLPVYGLNGTSLLLRVTPASTSSRPQVEPNVGKSEAGKLETASAQRAFKSTSQKSAVACEPPVSVLTDVAKLLEPGRCVT